MARHTPYSLSAQLRRSKYVHNHARLAHGKSCLAAERKPTPHVTPGRGFPPPSSVQFQPPSTGPHIFSRLLECAENKLACSREATLLTASGMAKAGSWPFCLRETAVRSHMGNLGLLRSRKRVGGSKANEIAFPTRSSSLLRQTFSLSLSTFPSQRSEQATVSRPVSVHISPAMSQPTTPLRSASSQSLQGAPQANEGFRRSNRLNRNPDNPSDASPEPRDAQQLAPTSKERRTNQSRKHEVIDLTGDDVDHDLEEAVGSAKDKPATEANAGNKVQLSPIWNPELGLGADTILCAAAGEQRIQGPLINCSVCRNACDGKFCVAKRCGCVRLSSLSRLLPGLP
jgi:hypothetical protein